MWRGIQYFFLASNSLMDVQFACRMWWHNKICGNALTFVKWIESNVVYSYTHIFSFPILTTESIFTTNNRNRNVTLNAAASVSEYLKKISWQFERLRNTLRDIFSIAVHGTNYYLWTVLGHVCNHNYNYIAQSLQAHQFHIISFCLLEFLFYGTTWDL